MNKSIKIAILAGALITHNSSCKKYLEIVPDNVAELDMAFNMRNTAERYLSTCYSYMPTDDNTPVESNYTGGVGTNPAYYLSLEATHSYLEYSNMTFIAQGNQNSNSPIASKWQSNHYWTGIRHCNIFLENIDKVPDMTEEEKKMWKAEVKVLKAYFHYMVFQQLGPIPIIDTNIPLGESSEAVKVRRSKVDDVLNFIINLLDEAQKDLPANTEVEQDYGRLNRIAALAIKAKVLTYAASPFYNGNTDYANFVNENNEPFFNQTYDPSKWVKALEACREAIQLAEENGKSLFEYSLNELPTAAQTSSETTKIQLNLRGALTETYNREALFSNPTKLNTSTQFLAIIPKFQTNIQGYGCYSISVNTAEEFYTKNGVPMKEDIEYNYDGRYDMITTPSTSSLFLIPNYKTGRLNTDREIRFYSTLGFDGGLWYGQGAYSESGQFQVMSKKGQSMVSSNVAYYNLTGYYAKKLVPIKYELKTDGSTSPIYYTWPIIRLADLYLLFAEAENEVNGPTDQAIEYLDKVRIRAGLKGTIESWANHSSNPTKPLYKEGLREIIRQERRIELALEGQKFWDFIRWKIAEDELSRPLLQWDTSQDLPEYYYRIKTVYSRQFTLKDYLWPIAEASLYSNKNLIQNPGW